IGHLSLDPPKFHDNDYSKTQNNKPQPHAENLMPDSQLKVGDPAPDFELMDQDKTKIKLSDFRGKKNVMLLFYPMDFSPTCTQEHCTFGPELPKIAPTADTVVVDLSC